MLTKITRPPPRGVDFILCDTPKRIEWLFKSLSGATRYAWDIETTHPTVKGDDEETVQSSSDDQIIGMSFCWSPTVAAYLPIYADKERNPRSLRADALTRVIEWLRREMQLLGKSRETWNGTFDKVWSRRSLNIEVPIGGADWMLGHHLLDENKTRASHRLKDCMGAYLGDPMVLVYEQDLQRALDQYDPNLRRYSMVPLEIIYPYGCADSWGTYMLGDVFKPMLTAENLDYVFNNITIPLQHVVTEIHTTGLPISREKIPQVQRDMREEIGRIKEEVQRLAGQSFDVGSTEQVSHILFDVLKLPTRGERGPSGFYSTDKDTLGSLEDAHPIVRHIQRFRRVDRNFTMYVQGLDKKSWVDAYYPNFKIHGTRSGRMSEQLIMSLPRGEKGGDIIKGLFQAPPGWNFMMRDLSQIELRFAAELSQDPIMVDGYRNGGPGFDLHALTAVKMFSNIKVPDGYDMAQMVKYVKAFYKAYRSIAKNLNFGALFGASAKRLMELINEEFPEMKCTIEQAQEFLDTYYKTMSKLRELIDNTYEFAKTYGYVLNMFGRKRRLPDAQIARLEDRSDERPRHGALRRCFGRQSPSITYDLKIPETEGFDYSSDEIRAMVIDLRNPKYSQPTADRAACSECRVIAPCISERERWSRGSRIDDAMRQAFSFVIQSSAVDYANLAFAAVHAEMKRLGLRSKPIIQIHDSIGFLVPDYEIEVMAELTRDRMENAHKMSIPITSELTICRNWGDENVHLPEACGRCKTKIDPTVLKEAVVSEHASYLEATARCGCGWEWSHNNVPSTTLT